MRDLAVEIFGGRKFYVILVGAVGSIIVGGLGGAFGNVISYWFSKPIEVTQKDKEKEFIPRQEGVPSSANSLVGDRASTEVRDYNKPTDAGYGVKVPEHIPSTFCNPINYSTDNPELDDMYNRAWNLSHGPASQKNLVDAREIYGSAARRGHLFSQYNYAVMLQEGQGGAKDYNAAIEWFERAAAKDHADSIHNLAAAYSTPWPGVDEDLGRSLEYYLDLARCENPEVLNNIGVIYASGFRGRDKDLPLAKRWFEKAEAKGSSFARKNIATISDGLQEGDKLIWASY